MPSNAETETLVPLPPCPPAQDAARIRPSFLALILSQTSTCPIRCRVLGTACYRCYVAVCGQVPPSPKSLSQTSSPPGSLVAEHLEAQDVLLSAIVNIYMAVLLCFPSRVIKEKCVRNHHDVVAFHFSTLSRSWGLRSFHCPTGLAAYIL